MAKYLQSSQRPGTGEGRDGWENKHKTNKKILERGDRVIVRWHIAGSEREKKDTRFKF